MSTLDAGDQRGPAQSFDPPTMMMGVVVFLVIVLLPTASATSPLLALPVILPWVLAAFALARRRADLAESERRGLALVALAGIAGPSVLLAMLAYLRAPLHDSTAAVLLPAAALAVLLGGATFAAVPALRGALAPYAAIGCLAYGFGGGVAANMVFDGSEPRLVRATVVDKWVSNPVRTSRTGSSTRTGPYFNVEVETYGSARVDTEVYSYSKVGQPGCVHVRDGSLGIEWFAIVRCPTVPRAR